MQKEKIKTILEPNELTSKEKGSEFIAKVYPIENEQSALNELQNIRKSYFDATHHCFAYRINNNLFKYSDDGEPKGTAGIRILNAIDHFEVVNVLLVVIRYFGGTKLGVGPLGKAYYEASINVLNTSKIAEMNLFQMIEVIIDFSNINNFHHIMNQYSTTIAKSDFSEKAKFNFFIKPSLIDKITTDLTNITNGQIVINIDNEYRYL